MRIFGFKGEGNYAQLWLRRCADVMVLGYGGNASPFPFGCAYPPGYARYQPSLFRVEQCGKVTSPCLACRVWVVGVRWFAS